MVLWHSFIELFSLWNYLEYLFIVHCLSFPHWSVRSMGPEAWFFLFTTVCPAPRTESDRYWVLSNYITWTNECLIIKFIPIVNSLWNLSKLVRSMISLDNHICVYKYRCTCIYIYTHTHIYIHIHVQSYRYAYICICLHMCVHIYIYNHMLVFVCVYICVSSSTEQVISSPLRRCEN